MSEGAAIAATTVLGGTLTVVGILAFVLALLVIAIILGVDLLAFVTDFHDADGAIDCWRECSTVQGAVKWSAGLGTYLFVVLVAALLVRAVVDTVGRHRRG